MHLEYARRTAYGCQWTESESITMQCAEKVNSYKIIYTTSLSGENRDIDQRSQQCDGVDVAAAVGSFAAGGEEIGVIVGTDATDLDVGL